MKKLKATCDDTFTLDEWAEGMTQKKTGDVGEWGICPKCGRPVQIVKEIRR